MTYYIIISYLVVLGTQLELEIDANSILNILLAPITLPILIGKFLTKTYNSLK